jgi:hypothetical protein
MHTPILTLNLTPKEFQALQDIVEGALEAAVKYGGKQEDINLFRSIHNKAQMEQMGGSPARN